VKAMQWNHKISLKGGSLGVHAMHAFSSCTCLYYYNAEMSATHMQLSSMFNKDEGEGYRVCIAPQIYFA
jgi:hypothetical protein